MSTKKDTPKKDVGTTPTKPGSAAERSSGTTGSKKSDRAEGGKMNVDRDEEDTDTKNR